MRDFISLWVFILLFTPASAQIQSLSADFSDSLTYTSSLEKDPYFIFHTPDQDGIPVWGSLEASFSAGTPPFDFIWTRWDTVSASFKPYSIDTVAGSSSITNLDWGCYRVNISSMDTDTMFQAWIFRNDPQVQVVKDTITGKIIPYAYTCDYLELEATAVADTILYYDLATNQPLYIDNGLSFEWTSDNPDLKIPGATSLLYIYIDNDVTKGPEYPRPPAKDTHFTLTATDSFGLVRADDVLYESVHVRAEFSILIEDEENPGQWIEQQNPAGEAPLQVRFRNLSVNGAEFSWVLIDSSKTGGTDEIVTLNLEDSVEFTYYYPGYYFPKLLAKGPEFFCHDSFPLYETVEIQVLPSDLDVPNVFTPNGDGSNDVFLVQSKSLKNYRIIIYNRVGKKVYEYEQREEKFEWEGWDGTVFGKGNRYAESGVYFYVIEALGWDGEIYRKNEPYKGFVYLIREKD
jgi:gliding motility-associated-like protein